MLLFSTLPRSKIEGKVTDNVKISLGVGPRIVSPALLGWKAKWLHSVQQHLRVSSLSMPSRTETSLAKAQKSGPARSFLVVF